MVRAPMEYPIKRTGLPPTVLCCSNASASRVPACLALSRATIQVLSSRESELTTQRGQVRPPPTAVVSPLMAFCSQNLAAPATTCDWSSSRATRPKSRRTSVSQRSENMSDGAELHGMACAHISCGSSSARSQPATQIVTTSALADVPATSSVSTVGKAPYCTESPPGPKVALSRVGTRSWPSRLAWHSCDSPKEILLDMDGTAG
mmetsp:Transcript_20842/g.38023  ORF Transcript_20842/g.38023 Transcript_20842/m.38023 type:complete len:205 (+) Transcript_20842:368-982(+)